MAAPGSTRPEVGDVLVVIHDFQARSSDELSLAKGDRVELTERDDEFGDGWFLGKHLVNGNSGLFPEVYTRPAPRNVPQPSSNASLPPKQPLSSLAEGINEQKPLEELKPAPAPEVSAPASEAPPVTLPLSSAKSVPAMASPISSFAAKPSLEGAISQTGRFNTSQDSHVLNETLNVINEHITDLNTPQGNGKLHSNNDSSSEYSSHMDHRLSYIQGEETDEEEEAAHSRPEVESWNPDQVAEYLFTAGVEKHHCEVFRDQEITGEVLLGMDQTSLFIKAFDLGPVGRRLKTWQKIKNLQDEVNGLGSLTRRTTGTFGSDAGSDVAGRVRSRTNTVTSVGQRLPSIDDRALSLSTRRLSQTPKLDPAQPVSPISNAQPLSPVSPISAVVDSPTRPGHEKRPSAASIRDLHHSRRHSSTDFRLTGTTLTTSVTPKLMASGTFPLQQDAAHKKQPSFDRNWTLGSAKANRPQSSAGFQDGDVNGSEPDLGDSAVDLDRGYFSGTDADPRRRNVLRKRDSVLPSGHSQKPSYAEEQRVRSATALSRHSRFDSVDSVREKGAGTSSAAQKYYGLSSTPHRRTASQATGDSIRPALPPKDGSPSVTRLDASPDQLKSSPKSGIKRLSQVNHPDFNVNMIIKGGLGGLRAASDAITGNEKSKITSPGETPLKDSPLYSPSRTGSSTPSAGPSFELESPDVAKSPSTTTTAVSRNSRKKSKKETSAYTRGLQKISPREAMLDADYSGWMKKKSSNLMTTWKPRLFVLKGRRLAYYYSEDDDQEKGLIDISFHRVLPADNERLTGLHATLTGAGNTPPIPAGSVMQTLAETDAERETGVKESDAMFIFKLTPPRAGLSRAVNFTKPTVHYFAVPNVKQGRLWMAALMKATIDRDDTQVVSTTYQQKTISLAKARQMRHRPPALMNLDEKSEDTDTNGDVKDDEKKDTNGLGIVYDEIDSGVSGLEKLGLSRVESARAKFAFGDDNDSSQPLSA